MVGICLLCVLFFCGRTAELPQTEAVAGEPSETRYMYVYIYIYIYTYIYRERERDFTNSKRSAFRPKLIRDHTAFWGRPPLAP